MAQVVAVAQVQSLAWELPHAAGATKKKKKKDWDKERESFRTLVLQMKKLKLRDISYFLKAHNWLVENLELGLSHIVTQTFFLNNTAAIN